MTITKFKTPYRDVPGESSLDRAKRITHEARIIAMFKKFSRESKGADRNKVAGAMVSLVHFGEQQADKDWDDINWDEYQRLARRVAAEANRFRSKKKAAAVKDAAREIDLLETR